jgi:amino acid transporter
VDAAFFLLVAFCLAFVSLLVVVRMKSAGAPNRRVVLLIAELWAVFALWTGILWAAATKLGIEPEGGGTPRLETLWSRLAALGLGERMLLVVSLFLGIAVFVHLLWALPQAMRED